METRRLREVAKRWPTALQANGEVSAPPLVWQCRRAWFELRCGRPGLLEPTADLPALALLPLMAGGDATGHLRELEAEIVPLQPNSKTTGSLGTLLVVACPHERGNTWLVSVRPHPDATAEAISLCDRFAPYFTAALQMERWMN